MPSESSAEGTQLPTVKILTLRRADHCACGTRLQAGDRAEWNKTTRTVRCLGCAAESVAATPFVEERTDGIAAESSAPIAADVPEVIGPGRAGSSAQAEFERRHARRVTRVRAAHPRLGGLILALSDDPQSTRAWQSGAVGERKLADRLAELGDAIIALHDRCVPGTRANLDHVVVGPAGAYVIDAKRYRNAKVSIRRSGGLLHPVQEQLLVSGRDRTTLATAMGWQVDAVRAALTSSEELRNVPITPALCFVDAEFPLFGTLEIGGVHVKGLSGIAKLVTRDGPLDAVTRDQVARHLALHLPAKSVK